MGFDPLRWIPSCSNEVEAQVLQEALQGAKKGAFKISSSWFDSYYHIDGKSPELTRRVYSLTNPAVDKEVEVKRALCILRVHTGSGEYQQLLSETLQNFSRGFSTKASVTCTSAVLTEHQNAQFAMLDYVELHRGDKIGFMPGATAVTQVTDITRSPDADIHSNIALTSAIETLNLLGCGLSSSFKIFPVYDAQDEITLDRIRSNLDAFTSRYNLAMEDYSSLKIGSLFYGASAIATTTKELPTKYDQVEEGMDIVVTNNFGGLPEISLYTLARMDSENIIKYETNGVSFEDITSAKDEAIKNLGEPHFALGKIISKYCPDFGSPLDKGSHIVAVYPVGSRGIFALGAVAELSNCQMAINRIPLKNDDIARFAAKEFLVENSTASTNGCHLIVATRDVSALVIEDLRKHNFAPESIGSVGKKGASSVAFASDLAVDQFVASKARLSRLVKGRVQEQQSTAN